MKNHVVKGKYYRTGTKSVSEGKRDGKRNEVKRKRLQDRNRIGE